MQAYKKTVSLLQRAFSVSSVMSSDNLFILDVWLKSKVTSHCFQAGSIFWLTSQPGMASKAACASPGSATSKTKPGYCRRCRDTGGQRWSDGAGGILRDTFSAVRGGGSKMRDVVELLVLEWDGCTGQGRHNRNICCALRSG